jgi:hypothetical protein
MSDRPEKPSQEQVYLVVEAAEEVLQSGCEARIYRNSQGELSVRYIHVGKAQTAD